MPGVITLMAFENNVQILNGLTLCGMRFDVFYHEIMRLTQCLLFFLFWMFQTHDLLAQTIAHTADFESIPSGSVTTNNQIPGWTVLASVAASATPDPNDDHCTLPTCCWTLSPTSSELINAPNGYTDPTLGSYYPIYSIFGNTPAPASAALANPQVSFPMGGSKFFRVGQPQGSGINRLVASIPVTDSTSFIDIAYISVINRAHTCCLDPGFRIEIDQATPCGTVLTNDCNNPQSVAGYFDVNSGNPAGLIFPHIFSKWRVKRYDLTPYMGSTVTIQISVYSCVFGLGPHQGYAYIDARCGSSAIRFNGVPQLTYQTKKTLISCEPVYTVSAPPYYDSYLWSGPQGFTSSQQNFTNSVSGTYTVVMGQNNNCASVTRTMEVFVVPPLVITQSNTLCPGSTVLLTASGVSTYTWLNTNSNSSTLAVSPPVSTIYTVLATDTNACIFKEEFHVIMNTPPIMNVIFTPSVCVGETMSLLATGANSYTWISSGQGAFSYSAQTSQTTGVPGLYTYSVIGALNTCTAITSVVVDVNPLPSVVISISPSATVCSGQEVRLSATGGVSYEWAGPASLTYTTSQITYHPSQTTLFVLRVKDAKGCVAESAQALQVHPKHLNTIQGLTKSCVPFRASIQLENKPGAKAVTWHINRETYSGALFQYVFKTAGTYTLQAVTVDSIYLCTDTTQFYLVAYPRPHIDFTYSPEKIHERDDVQFVNRSESSVLNCEWYFSERDKITTCLPEITHSFVDRGLYAVVLTAKNEHNCRDTIIKTLEVLPEYFIYVPNAFTPNSDGTNDVFAPVHRGLTFYTLEIFDRWGEKIFESNQPDVGWNGQYKGRLCQTGVYIWKMKVSTVYGETKTLTGHLTLLGED